MKKRNLKNLMSSPEQAVQNNEINEIKAKILEKYKLEKIICFGSQIHTIKRESCFLTENGFSSNSTVLNSYCLLLIPSKGEKTPDIKIQQRIEEDFKSFASLAILVHRMEEFNNALQNGSSFFTSIFKRGIILHDNNEESFVSPVIGKPINERISQKEEFWNHWFALSSGFIKGGRFFIDEGESGLAVFMFHQSLQHCYSAMIRVLTGYRTNSNSLRRLLKLIDNAIPDSAFLHPNKSTPEDARLTSVLLKGFSDARYDNSLVATKDELTSMMLRISTILNNANTICSERIINLKSGTEVYMA